MAIKDPLMFITIEEFKNWKGFNNQLFDEIITPDSEIRYAIEIASSNIDYLSGFTISKKWPEINPTKFTDNVQTATTHYVNFLLSKGVEYARGQASIGQGGIVYSQNNPEEPYFIPPQVFNYLREINEYLNIKGFNLKGIEPQTNKYFNKFISNYGEDSPLNAYIPYPNIKSLDDRTKITITHPLNMLRPVVNIDTSNIKTDIDNSLWEVDKDNPNFIKPKDDKGIDVNGRRIIDVGTPTFLSDATTKQYVDKKQDKLIAGENIKIDEKTNTISATGGSVDLSDYYKKEEIDNKWLEDFPIDFKTNANYNEIEDLQTEAKQIVPAINENKENIDKKQGKRSKNLTTTAKTIVEGINENKSNIDKKQDKLISTEEVVIEDNKITFTKEFLEKIGDFIMHFQQFDDLTTVNKILINAINELNKKLSDFMLVQPIIKNEVWKEVGTITGNNTSITYDFKTDKLYRLSFSWLPVNLNESVIKMIEFYVMKEKPRITILETYYQENNQNLRLCLSNNLIVVLNYWDKRVDNCLYKLQELQE